MSAKQWLDMYVAAINSHMQERQVKRVTNNINYLQAQIEQSSIAKMRDVFYNIIEEQMKNKMLAEASPDYVFVTVSPSMVPEVKSQPQAKAQRTETKSMISVVDRVRREGEDLLNSNM